MDDARIRLLSEPRQGLAFARNAGVVAALGSIVAFTDDDVEVARDWVETIVSSLDGNPAVDGVGGRVLPAWECGPRPTWLTREHWAPLALQDHGDTAVVRPHQPIGLIGANVAFRREVFERIGAVLHRRAASEGRDRIDRRSRAARAALRGRRADALSAADAGARARASRSLRSRLPSPLARGARPFPCLDATRRRWSVAAVAVRHPRRTCCARPCATPSTGCAPSSPATGTARFCAELRLRSSRGSYGLGSPADLGRHSLLQPGALPGGGDRERVGAQPRRSHGGGRWIDGRSGRGRGAVSGAS